MGKTARYIAATQAGIAQDQPLIAQRRRLFEEETRVSEQQLLGTEEQIAGFGGDPRGIKYAQEYRINPATLKALQYGHKYASPAGISRDIQTAVDQANTIQQRAQAAAEAGDFTTAESLHQQGQTFLSQYAAKKGIMGFAYSGAISLGGAEAEEAAKAKLSTPIAVDVGRYLERGRRLFEDREDPELQQKFTEYVDPTFKSTAAFRAAGRRTVLQEAQAVAKTLDIGTQAGSARRLYQKFAREEQLRGTTQGALQRIEATARQEEAEILRGANTFLEDWVNKLSSNAIRTAESFLQAADRDQFQSALDNLSAISSTASTQLAQFAEQLSAGEEARAQQLSAMRQDIASQAVGFGAQSILEAFMSGSF